MALNLTATIYSLRVNFRAVLSPLVPGELLMLTCSPDRLPDLLTRQDIANMTQLHPKTVSRLARDNKFPKPLFLCRCPRWRRDDVLAFLEKAGKLAVGDLR